MTLHFAYGSNMSRALMGARCPDATALGVATLVQGEPLVLSIAHQVGAIFVLAAALAPAMRLAPPHASGFAPAPIR